MNKESKTDPAKSGLKKEWERPSLSELRVEETNQLPPPEPQPS